jgi:putative DNA primase/helicase
MTGLVEYPIIRPDGSILSDPGYDPATGLFLKPTVDVPPIPDRPTLDDAEHAAGVLFDLVGEFPWCQDHDKAAWLAALLTPLARWAIRGPTPLFLVDANCPGSGKSKLCDLVATIATGRAMSRTTWPTRDDAEVRKRLTSIAMTGEPMTLFDNIDGSFGSASLDAWLTGESWSDRILGRSGMTGDLPIVTTTFATGNNVVALGDLPRRVIPVRLEARQERPEERDDFKHADLLDHACERRGEYLRAALVILKAHAAAGRPGAKLTPMDYPAWCRVVRNAVHWCTGLDPAEGRTTFRENDTESAGREALILGWAELMDSGVRRVWTAAQALEFVKERPEACPTLHDALAELATTGELPSAKSLGKQLQKLRGRVVSGRKLSTVKLRAKAIGWTLVNT